MMNQIARRAKLMTLLFTILSKTIDAGENTTSAVSDINLNLNDDTYVAVLDGVIVLCLPQPTHQSFYDSMAPRAPIYMSNIVVSYNKDYIIDVINKDRCGDMSKSKYLGSDIRDVFKKQILDRNMQRVLV